MKAFLRGECIRNEQIEGFARVPHIRILGRGKKFSVTRESNRGRYPSATTFKFLRPLSKCFPIMRSMFTNTLITFIT
jgi:hypothetical protein